MSRAVLSVPPPAAEGTTSSSPFSGFHAACAAAGRLAPVITDINTPAATQMPVENRLCSMLQLRHQGLDIGGAFNTLEKLGYPLALVLPEARHHEAFELAIELGCRHGLMPDFLRERPSVLRPDRDDGTPARLQV